MVRWFWLSCFVGALLLQGGCDSGPKMTKVSGTVELDGKPLDDGSISLYGAEGTAPQTFEVKNGKFEGQATPGKKRVEISAFRPGKPAMMGDKEVEGTGGKENYLPSRYNTESKLTAEVTATAINPTKFEVSEK
jgi:hypothetical protein